MGGGGRQWNSGTVATLFSKERNAIARMGKKILLAGERLAHTTMY